MARRDEAADEGTRPALPGTRKVGESSSSTTSELFFDLVFVFAFVQVTTLMGDDFSVRGVLNGLLVLTVLWWSWSNSVWVANQVRADFGLTRVVLLAITTVLFLLAVTTREAFTDAPGGVDGPLVFAVCYFVVRAVNLGLRQYAFPDTTLRDFAVLSPPLLIGSALLFAAALLPQRMFHHPTHADAAQTGFWAAAAIIDFGIAIRLPARRRVASARHWSERHGLIVLVALGESLIAIGLGSLDLPLSWWLIWVAILGLAVAAALEWLYFDVVALAGEQSLRRCPPVRRVGLARDAYTYLHLPMIAGVILYALGLKKIIASADPGAPNRPATFEGLELYALYGGVALFLLGHVAFQLRTMKFFGTIVWPRLAAVVVLVALMSVTTGTALTALGRLAACCAVLVVVEAIVANGRHGKLREDVLTQHADEPEGADADGSRPDGR